MTTANWYNSTWVERHIQKLFWKNTFENCFPYNTKLTQNNCFLNLNRFKKAAVTINRRNKLMWQQYFGPEFSSNNFDLKPTYIMPQLVPKDPYLQTFQYKKWISYISEVAQRITFKPEGYCFKFHLAHGWSLVIQTHFRASDLLQVEIVTTQWWTYGHWGCTLSSGTKVLPKYASKY